MAFGKPAREVPQSFCWTLASLQAPHVSRLLHLSFLQELVYSWPKDRQKAVQPLAFLAKSGTACQVTLLRLSSNILLVKAKSEMTSTLVLGLHMAARLHHPHRQPLPQRNRWWSARGRPFAPPAPPETCGRMQLRTNCAINLIINVYNTIQSNTVQSNPSSSYPPASLCVFHQEYVVHFSGSTSSWRRFKEDMASKAPERQPQP